MLEYKSWWVGNIGLNHFMAIENLDSLQESSVSGKEELFIAYRQAEFLNDY